MNGREGKDPQTRDDAPRGATSDLRDEIQHHGTRTIPSSHDHDPWECPAFRGHGTVGRARSQKRAAARYFRQRCAA